MEREAFLRRLSGRLPMNRTTPARPDPVPVMYRMDEESTESRFARALERVGAELVPADRLWARLRQLGVRTVVAPADIELPAELMRVPAGRVAAADAGISRALRGVAVTGSVLVSGQEGRTVSILPPVHVALLERSSLVETPGEVLRSLPFPRLPASFVLISGPSKSADIQHRLTVGVHGPKHVLVVLTSGGTP